MFLIDYHHCVVPENIHTPMGEATEILSGGGLKRWQPPRMEIPGGRGLKQNFPPWGVWIFSGTTHYSFKSLYPHTNSLHSTSGISLKN